jgi:hypothetical protein
VPLAIALRQSLIAFFCSPFGPSVGAADFGFADSLVEWLAPAVIGALL